MIHFNLSSSCETGVVELGTFDNGPEFIQLIQFRDEAVAAFGNACVETYCDDELVVITEYGNDTVTSLALSNVPGAGGLALFEEGLTP